MSNSIITSEQVILVCKTNIRNKRDAKKVGVWLEDMKGILSWNVDLKDKDKILRIVSEGADIQDVIYQVKKTGFDCEELKY